MRKSKCCHHWVIDFPAGPLSQGACRVCGEERLFRNQLMWSEVAPLGETKDRREAGVGLGLLAGSRCRPSLVPRRTGGSSLFQTAAPRTR